MNIHEKSVKKAMFVLIDRNMAKILTSHVLINKTRNASNAVMK